jgi:hypothetical protein
MAKSKTSELSRLDPNIASLAGILNSFKGITTVGSCGGHPSRGMEKELTAEWVVIFMVEHSAHGWRALEFLAWLVNNDARRGGAKVRLEPFAPPPYLNSPGHCLVFHLRGWGDEHPEEVARMIAETKHEYFDHHRASRTSKRQYEAD